jgi:hypothetical protein
MTSPDALVRKVLTDEHADLVREAVSVLCHEIMEAEVTAQIGARHNERAPAEAHGPPQRLPRASLRHPGREPRAVHAQAALRLVLPELSGAAPGRKSMLGADSCRWWGWLRPAGCRAWRGDLQEAQAAAGGESPRALA